MMNSKKFYSIMVIFKYGESNWITKKCNDIEILYIYRNLRAIKPHAVRIKYHRIKSTKFCLMLGICTINTRSFGNQFKTTIHRVYMNRYIVYFNSLEFEKFEECILRPLPSIALSSLTEFEQAHHSIILKLP